MKQQFLWLLLAGGLMAGCNKLDQLPESTASKDAVFGSEKGLELYAYSFYDILPDANAIHRGDEMSDYGARTQAPDFLREGGFNSRQSSGWTWTQLRNINYFIENCTNPRIPEDVRKNYIGLARFFRAYFYFDKVKRFGDVPWINKTMPVGDSNLFNGRDSRLKVMDSVLADLNYACENIKATDDKTRSLVTKYVAYAFKSRVCLFEGTFRRYHKDGLAKGLEGTIDKWLTEAANAADKVMKDGGFSLNTANGTDKSYRQLFINKAPVTNEIIMAAVCDAALSVFNDANWYWTSATYGARLSFTRTFINTYLNIDGTPFTSKAGYETMPFVDEVKGRDLRLQQTIRMGDYKRINADKPEPAPPVFSYTYTGYQPIKWCVDDTYPDGGTRNENSISMIRFAEVLLNYAEAKAELGTLTADDWKKTVGALRKRAGITGNTDVLPTVADTYLQTKYFPGLNAVLLEVRRERGIELALEGLRFYDLVRWKRGDLLKQEWNGFYVPALDVPMDLNGDGKNDVFFYKVKPATQVAGVTYINVAEVVSGVPNPQRLSKDTYGELTWLNNIKRVWEDKHYLYPIPEADRQMNPKLGQNPGWD
ncbi:RagB/SusD family nutrient uptake outer membrane protein [Paraflavitalea soli]|uniref:RagB/SusD family nutrient uptake outer membrane protein n=1 Tax=Paraflavitalea soli TaxID=2315862 RepID=A0A3B7MQE0_9BACT|nr:RagB/SusD family nutrient uptake outer membrane protein [Paraflavitalea soli]AXY76754.1 RagB/SusD family nutrient uptake outer membrane protein [Paraflavitalea soli]